MGRFFQPVRRLYRNFFRHQLIPAIRGVFPEVEQNLLDNIARFRDSYILFRQSAEEHKKLLEKAGESMRIAVGEIKKDGCFENRVI